MVVPGPGIGAAADVERVSGAKASDPGTDRLKRGRDRSVILVVARSGDT